MNTNQLDIYGKKKRLDFYCNKMFPSLLYFNQRCFNLQLSSHTVLLFFIKLRLFKTNHVQGNNLGISFYIHIWFIYMAI